jgi:hypothetical protein
VLLEIAQDVIQRPWRSASTTSSTKT